MGGTARRWATRGVVALAAALLALLSSSANPVGYVARQGWYEAELLLDREPLARALAERDYTPEQRANLERVPRIKEFGRRIGLAASANYDTISPDWDREIWNVSACAPLAFQSRRWWFPIVGSMPYIGFFREDAARARVRELREQGWDVYARTAGAYSTLGWFADPVLPSMLDWSEYQLAETVLHELAHATLWVRGSAQFNESFANVVGEHAALAYMTDVYGADSDEVRQIHVTEADTERYNAVMHQLYLELEALYADPMIRPERKRVLKGQLFASVPTRLAAAGMSASDRVARTVQRGSWNNARLVQFRTYNRSSDWFETVLAQQDGDLSRFVEAIRDITSGADDPWAALAEAAGVDPAALELGDG